VKFVNETNLAILTFQELVEFYVELTEDGWNLGSRRWLESWLRVVKVEGCQTSTICKGGTSPEMVTNNRSFIFAPFIRVDGG
jgi:hypothetical protein